MEAGYELFDHTADLGVRVRAPLQEWLIAPAIEGLYAAIGGLAAAPPRQVRTLEFAGDDAAVLLRDLLAEVLYLFERERLMVVGTAVEIFSNARLRVEVDLAEVPADARFDREVKAVTYHDLRLEQIADGFEAEYIVDI
jgi:SHS2 domain-containing protein